MSLAGRDGSLEAADVVVICVPDRAINDVVSRLPAGVIALHCSGSAPVDALRPHAPAGSLHPLMTFPGPERHLPDLHGVAAAVDGDDEAVAAAEVLARAAGMRPMRVRGDRRLYHTAAVIAGNFMTTLLADAATVLQAVGVPPEESAETLLPLALASLRNAAPDPRAALTGPVVRGDEPTIAGHRDALRGAGLGDLLAEYDTLTERTRTLAKRSAKPYTSIKPRGDV